MSRAEVGQTQADIDALMLKDMNLAFIKAQTFSELLVAVGQIARFTRRYLTDGRSISQNLMQALLNTVKTAFKTYDDLNEENPEDTSQEKSNVLLKCMEQLLRLFSRYMNSPGLLLKNCMIDEFIRSTRQMAHTTFPAEIYFSFLSHAPVLPFDMRDSHPALKESSTLDRHMAHDVDIWNNGIERSLGCAYLREYFCLLNLACKSIASGNASEASIQSLNAFLEKVITVIPIERDFLYACEFIGYGIVVEELTTLSKRYVFFAQACAAAIEKQLDKKIIFYTGFVPQYRLLHSLKISIEKIHSYFARHPEKLKLTSIADDGIVALKKYESEVVVKQIDPYSSNSRHKNFEDYVFNIKRDNCDRLIFSRSFTSDITILARIYFEKLRMDVLDAISPLKTLLKDLPMNDSAALKNLEFHLSDSEASGSRDDIVSHIARTYDAQGISDNTRGAMSALKSAVLEYAPKRDSRLEINLLEFYLTTACVVASIAAEPVTGTVVRATSQSNFFGGPGLSTQASAAASASSLPPRR